MDDDSLYDLQVDEFGNVSSKITVPKQVRQSPVSIPVLPDNTDIRERAKAVENDIFKTYYTLMMAETTPPAIKKSCADALADRARGKPSQSTEITGKITHETLIIQRTPRTSLPVIDAEEL